MSDSCYDGVWIFFSSSKSKLLIFSGPQPTAWWGWGGGYTTNNNRDREVKPHTFRHSVLMFTHHVAAVICCQYRYHTSRPIVVYLPNSITSSHAKLWFVKRVLVMYGTSTGTFKITDGICKDIGKSLRCLLFLDERLIALLMKKNKLCKRTPWKMFTGSCSFIIVQLF